MPNYSYQPQVKIHADSYNLRTGDRLVTFEISNFPKNLLAELNTHRVFSRNAASSRAIPVKKVIERIKANPYLPAFTKNQPGMVGKPLTDQKEHEQALALYLEAMQFSIDIALKLVDLGLHKEPINRLLEPWMTVPVLISGTEWSNFFKLRCSADASPHFNLIACTMRDLMAQSTPTLLSPYSLHTLFDKDLFDDSPQAQSLSLNEKMIIMAARCARISYINHGSDNIDLSKDLKLGHQLLMDQHLSPFEHIAFTLPPDDLNKLDTKNYRGFCSFRALLESNQPLPQLTIL